MVRRRIVPRILLPGFTAGALLAKRRLAGNPVWMCCLQIWLYERLGRHAVEMAAALKKGLKQRGCCFFRESPTNQQSRVSGNDRMDRLKSRARELRERYDEDHSCSFCNELGDQRGGLEHLWEILDRIEAEREVEMERNVTMAEISVMKAVQPGRYGKSRMR